MDTAWRWRRGHVEPPAHPGERPTYDPGDSRDSWRMLPAEAFTEDLPALEHGYPSERTDAGDPRGPYPAPRERGGHISGLLTDRFRPHQSTAGYVALATAIADVIVFAGVPDKIELFTRDAGVVIQFTDRADVEQDSIELPAGMFYEPGLVSEKVRARNAVAGQIGSLQVVGKYLHATPTAATQEPRVAR